MTIEKHIKLGKKELSVGLDFSFGFMLILKRFNLELDDFKAISSKNSNESFGFISKIVQAAHLYYCEQNDEESVLTNESKAMKFVTEIGLETVTGWLLESVSSFAPADEDSDELSEKKDQPLAK